MASLNRVEIIGHLGQDPEIRRFDNGGMIANLSVATSRKWKNRAGEVQEKTEWHRVSVTADGLAGIAEKYLRKGSRVYCSGRLETRKWQDQNGNDRYSTEIILAAYEGQMILLGDGRGGSRDDGGYSGGTSGGASGGGQSGGPDIDDETPF